MKRMIQMIYVYAANAHKSKFKLSESIRVRK